MPDPPEAPLLPSRNGPRRLQAYILRLFHRLNLSEQHFLIALAMIVGIGGGFGSVLFRELLEVMHHLLLVTGRSLLGRPYLMPLIPAVGGLAAGLLDRRWGPAWGRCSGFQRRTSKR